MSLSTRTRLGIAALLALVATLATTGTGPAAGTVAAHHEKPASRHHDRPPHHDKRQLKVMTQNLYLGSDLGAAIGATTTQEFLTAVAGIYGTARFTDFPRRARAIADEIAAERPDLIGLQEVTNWIVQRTDAGTTPPSYDFLAILQSELAKRGLDYRVGVVSQNADIGPVPLVAPSFGCIAPATPDCVVTLQDRDVILVDHDTRGLHVRDRRTGDYRAQAVLTPPVGAPVSFARGWAYLDATYAGKRFRFATTHLEVEDYPDVQEEQGREFLAGPARAPGAVIATGDFNSAADPATTDKPTGTYAALTKSWFDDAWWVNGDRPGLSCCQSSTLSNTVSQLRTRIDLVLLHGPARARSAHLVGDTPIPGATSPPFWASDHAGVVATLRLH